MCFSDDKIYRAFIPSNKVKWFSDLINDTPKIDIWLSIRLHRATTNFNTTHFGGSSNYKYFSEFRLRYRTQSELENLTSLLKQNHIKLEVIFDNLNQIEPPLRREKRLITEMGGKRPLEKKQVYKSFNEVIFLRSYIRVWF